MCLDDLLRRQAGVLTRAQALAAGIPPTTLTRWIAAGRLIRVLPRVYRAAGREETPESRLHAAALWAGTGAAVCGPAAAWWHGLLTQPPRGPVAVTVPRDRRPRAPRGVRVRRRDLDPADVTGLRGLRVTALALTVLDVAVGWPDGPAILDRALQRRTTLDTLVRCHHRNLGRHGSPAAGALLAAAADGAASAAERLPVALLRANGIEGWVLGHPVGGYLLDVAFPAARVGVEVDGWAWHSDVERFRGDRRRQNALVVAGWTVLRFTWHGLTARPRSVVTEIHAALRR